MPELTREQQLANLIDSRPTACPNTYADGCRCPEHDPGLMRYAPDLQAYDAALARCRPEPVRLHVLTMGPPRPGCDGSMTCPCEKCARERSSIGAKGAGRAQFKVRAPRAMRSAA